MHIRKRHVGQGTETGYTEHKCSVCGDTYKSDYTNTTDHDYALISGTGDNGTYQCTVCGNSYSNKSVGIGTVYHSQKEIIAYMGSSGASPYHNTIMEVAPDYTVPYSQGTVTEKSLMDALAMLNQFRYFAGLNYDIALNDEYTRLAQAGAFVNAVNGVMSHYPDQPEGMSDEMFADAEKGAGSSNIAYAGGTYNLSRFVELWVDDTDDRNIDRLGHRRWMLNPAMKETGFGYVVNESGATYSSMYAFDRAGSSAVQGVAWPARETPIEYFTSRTAWSYSYGQVLEKESITVKVACQNPGSDAVWEFSEALNERDGYFNVDNGGYGQMGCVIFLPNGISTEAGMHYLVTVSRDGEVIAEYTVNFF